MRHVAFKIIVSLVLGPLSLAQGQSTKNTAVTDSIPSPAAPPVYRITFKKGAPISGVGAVPGMKLPFDCTSDGTVFFDMVPPIGVVGQSHTLPSRLPSLLLLSVSLTDEARSFPLDQVPDLYDLSRIDDYASDSQVIFLVRAASEDKQERRMYTNEDGVQHESTVNVADHYHYIVAFDRKANYQTKIKIEGAPFEVTKVAVFPSGKFLAYGYDKTDKTPRLAMLNDDGTLLKFLTIPRGDAPDSAIQTKDATDKGLLAPVQFSGQGALIYMVQNKSKFPLLEVNEAGAIRVINPRLPEETRINMLIPSDHNLYSLTGDLRDASIYELSPQDGSILRFLQIDDEESGTIVACVHEGKFLSFEHSGLKLVPLIGTAEPSATKGVSIDSVKRDGKAQSSSEADHH